MISVVQRAIGYDPNGANGDITATFGSANGAGNTVIVCIAIADTTTTGQAVPTDSAGNSYSSIANFSNGSAFTAQAWFIANNITAYGGSNVVTSNPDLGACNMHIWEVSGLFGTTTLDASNSTFATTGTALTSGASGVTKATNELLLGVFCNDQSVETWTLGSGWSNLLSSTATQTNAFSSASEEQIVSGVGSYTATITAGHSVTNLSVIMTFKGRHDLGFITNHMRPHLFSPGLAR